MYDTKGDLLENGVSMVCYTVLLNVLSLTTQRLKGNSYRHF